MNEPYIAPIDTDHAIPLSIWKGLLSSCAIENHEHEIALMRLNRLIDIFGPVKRVGSWIIPFLYRHPNEILPENEVKHDTKSS
jgi:hypothetical protein